MFFIFSSQIGSSVLSENNNIYYKCKPIFWTLYYSQSAITLHVLLRQLSARFFYSYTEYLYIVNMHDYINIYWTPKETLQSSLLYYFIKCVYMVFLHPTKVVRDMFEDKCQIWTRCSEAELLQVDLNSLHDLHDISTSGYYEGEKN